MKDLLVLTADSNAKFALRALLRRTTELGCSCVLEDGDILSHPRHDPGVVRESADYVRNYISQYSNLIVCFDYKDCGQKDSVEVVEGKLEQILSRNGWEHRVSAIAFSPELEILAWNSSRLLAELLKFKSYDQLESELVNHGFAFNAGHKPVDPKEALEHVLRASRIPRSSSFYSKLAEKLNFKSCSDRAFRKLSGTLHRWFPLQQ